MKTAKQVCSVASPLYHLLASGGFPKSGSGTAWGCWCVDPAAERPGPVTGNLKNSSHKEARRQEAGGRLAPLETLRAKRKGTSPRQCSSRQDRGDSAQPLTGVKANTSPFQRTNTHAHVWSCLHSLVTLSPL